MEGNSGDSVSLILTLLDTASDPVTGEAQGDFTYRLYNKGASSALPVTITELGGGDYLVQFTPDEPGDWRLSVRHTATKAEFVETVGVGLAAAAKAGFASSGSGSIVSVSAYLSRNGRRVTDATAAIVSLYDSEGNLAGSVTLAVEDRDAHGFFTGAFPAYLEPNNVYGYIVTITDPGGTVVSPYNALKVSA